MKMGIIDTDEAVMKAENSKLHKLNHFGCNKLKIYVNTLF
jgi:hypothetical protein